MVAYARFLARELPKTVGLDEADGRRMSDGRAGHICHGPYITLGPGAYTAGFYVKRAGEDAEGEIEVDACTAHGQRILARRTTPVRDLFSTVDGFVPVDFTLDSVERACEMRLHVPARARIEVTRAVLYRRDLSHWGAR